MIFYTLADDFTRQELISDFESAVWTERFNDVGEVELAVPPTPENIRKLAAGVFLAKPGTKEVMQLETQLIENGLLRVTGKSLLDILNYRINRGDIHHSVRSWTWTGTPSATMRELVKWFCVDPSMDRSPAHDQIRGDLQIIPGLTLVGEPDPVGVIDMEIEFGPLFTALKNIADNYNIGMRLVLNSAVGGLNGFTLAFETYFGRDFSSSLIFSERLDTLADVKELYSVAQTANLVLVYAGGAGEEYAGNPGRGMPFAYSGVGNGFNIRYRMESQTAVTAELIAADPDRAANLLTQTAQVLATKLQPKRIVEGSVPENTPFKYGVDYRLGDIVGLQGLRHLTITRARVTEYIYTQDGAGEKEYPTISIIE